MPAELVRASVHAGVATLTLDNPPLNVVTLALTRELDRRLDALAADPGVLVLVVAGTGDRAFCAGSDISEFPALRDAGDVVARKLAFENATYGKLDHFPRPTIAALEGAAYGGGLELAVCCDLIVAAEGVRMGLPEIKLGVFPASGGTIRVARRVGEGRAKELMFTGEPIDAPTALAWGLVNRVVPRGGALAAALELAALLATRPGRALALCKQAIDLGLDVPEHQAVRQTLPLSDAAFATEDCAEGVRAFFAKEPPRFRHR